MIDPHVHLRDWGQKEKETLSHGYEVASLCQVQEVFDMPNTVPPLTDSATVERRLQDARDEGLGSFYHLYAGLTDDPEQIGEVVALCRRYPSSVIGLKLFAGHSTGRMGQVEERQQRSVYRVLSSLGYRGVVAVHCEKESLLRPELEDARDFSSHSLARPVEAEMQSVADQLAFAAEAGFAGTLHVCHLSSPRSLALVEKAREQGRRVTCGVTPHHALLSVEDAKDYGSMAKMNPPLRTREEQEALFSALLAGKIDWIETDHAPHTVLDKQNGSCGIPGFPGLLLLVKALMDNGCPQGRLLSLLGERVRQVFGLEGDPITVPAYGDLERLSAEAAACYGFDPYRNCRKRV
jgi:dihydroorotase